jgi:glycosyltransferase involved in cell wall biosynthesis
MNRATAAAPTSQAAGSARAGFESRPVRVAVICDFAEENWPSMDWAAETLLAGGDTRFQPQRIAPTMRRRFSRLPGMRDSRRAFNLDRVLARYRDYPRWLRSRSSDCDLFHIADHSYAHLALELPPQRTIITCHDVDVFRGLLGESRSALPARFAQRTLKGLRSAARVICDSAATRSELAARGLLAHERSLVVPLPIAPEYFRHTTAALPQHLQDKPFLLHVGSSIPRKRIDLLLRIFAAARAHHPELLLVRVGGELTPGQQSLARQLGISRAICILPPLDRPMLAAIYRSAAALLLTSESEGFGLPVAEALACGTPVIAADIAVLHEVGSDLAHYCALGEVPAWTRALDAVFALRADAAAFAAWRDRAAAYAQRFRPETFTVAIRAIYQQVLAEAQP